MERGKCIIKEKYEIIKDELKLLSALILNTNTNTIKSASSETQSICSDLETEINYKEKELSKLRFEKEIMKNKLNNLSLYSGSDNEPDAITKTKSKSNSKSKVRIATNRKPDNLKPFIIYEKSDKADELKNITPTNITNDVIFTSDIIKEINSNADEVSYMNMLKEKDDDKSKSNFNISIDDLLLKSSQNSFFKSQEIEIKKLYKEFIKIFLKIKFERVPENHYGHKIPEKVMFKECIKRGVPVEKYKEFIEEEMNMYKKYEKYLLKGKSKVKGGLSKPMPMMEIIDEE